MDKKQKPDEVERALITQLRGGGGDMSKKSLKKDNPFYAILSPNCPEEKAAFNSGCYCGYERARKDGLLLKQRGAKK